MYTRLKSEEEMMRNAEMSREYQSPSEIGLQSCPSYLDYTSGSCSSLTTPSGHRRVRKMKKAQAKELRWKYKH